MKINIEKHLDRLFRLDNINFSKQEEKIATDTLRNLLEDSSVKDIASLGKDYVKSVTEYNDQMSLFAKYIKSLCFHKSTNGLIIYGLPGLGKTYQVKSQLDYVTERNPQITYKYFKGKITVTQLYINAYLNRNSILVFDDCDNVFTDVNCMNILKAMTDSYEHRLVSYSSPAIPQSIPKEFEFRGKVIIITNQDLADNPHMDALTSRMLPVTVEITQDQAIAKSIDNILTNPAFDKRAAIIIARFIWENREVFATGKYSLRTSQQLLQIYELMNYDYDDFIGYAKSFLKQYDWSKLKTSKPKIEIPVTKNTESSSNTRMYLDKKKRRK